MCSILVYIFILMGFYSTSFEIFSNDFEKLAHNQNVQPLKSLFFLLVIKASTKVHVSDGYDTYFIYAIQFQIQTSQMV